MAYLSAFMAIISSLSVLMSGADLADPPAPLSS